VGNLNKHLKRHSISNEWYKLYLKSSKTICNKLSDTKLNFIKFIITSNLALKQLENVYLRKCLKEEIKIPCMKTFQFTFLQEILDLLKDKIEEKCQNASYITIIPDLWSDLAITHYLG
jgi:hypothetical protein